MTEPNAGFRFDIYERVHLPEERPAIGDLEQIELLPFVRGVPGQEQSQLKGYLQLTAVYAPIDDNGERLTFSHRIPVEITLPVRASSEDEEVQVQIDQFDVELISNRSLNVTGVLSLSGWYPRTSAAEVRSDASKSSEDEQEIVAAYESEKRKPKSDPIKVVTDDAPHSHFQENGFDEQVAAYPEHEAAEANVPPEAMPVFDPFAVPGTAASENPEEEEEMREPAYEQPFENDDDAEEALEAALPENELDLDEADAAEPVSAEPAMQEPKIAFKPQESEESGTGEADPPKKNNELEWRKLFFGSREETHFKKMRMCIVQKEDTIDSIAERYQLNPREIALYNRLGESEVSEGQILYIPL